METRDLALEDMLVSKAIECFGDALVCDNNFTSAKFHQGLMFRRTGNFNEAIRQFTRVMEKLYEDATVYIERGLVYQDMGNHHYAIADFRKAIDIDEKYANAYFYNGISKLKSGQTYEAIEDF